MADSGHIVKHMRWSDQNQERPRGSLRHCVCACCVWARTAVELPPDMGAHEPFVGGIAVRVGNRNPYITLYYIYMHNLPSTENETQR
jgi:hypothetical protein